MTTRLEKFLIAIMVALLLAGVTIVFAQAQDLPEQKTQTSELTCINCHREFVEAWETSGHAQAGNDPAFMAQWTEQGKPGACLACHVTGYDPASATWQFDGISCQACHSPITADHPKSPMPVKRSIELCGACHSDARFGWQDWKASTHYQRNMLCVACHDPHTSAMKDIAVADPFESQSDASRLCINCHRDASMQFPYSIHYQQGLSCTDCHITRTSRDERDIHTVPDHSFEASLKACNACHKDSMHSPAISEHITERASLNPMSIQMASVVPQPQAVSPVGWAGMAALIGLAAGMILAPWLEKLYKRTFDK